jgi:hypothetical protein
VPCRRALGLTVVGRVDYVGFVQSRGGAGKPARRQGLEGLDEGLDHVVDGLQSRQPPPVKQVHVAHHAAVHRFAALGGQRGARQGLRELPSPPKKGRFLCSGRNDAPIAPLTFAIIQWRASSFITALKLGVRGAVSPSP